MPDYQPRSEDDQDRLLLEIAAAARTIAARKVRSDEVDDVVQSVVAACLESLRTGTWSRAPENMEAFAFALVKNQMVDRQRRRSTSARHDLDHLRARREAPAPCTAPDRFDEEEFIADFQQRVIESLPSRCGCAYSMVRYAGLSYDEVGVLLDISPGTVRAYINQAHKRFRDELRLIGIESGSPVPRAGAKPHRRKGEQERLAPRYPRPGKPEVIGASGETVLTSTMHQR
jgi:RNA polymerase sigma factor (sigma-70 family)